MSGAFRGGALLPTLVCVRHGHMVKLPGNVWSTKEWIKTPKAKVWRPKKGTLGFKLDTIRPHDDLLEPRPDPEKEFYSYQLDPYPNSKSCDPIEPLCKVTKTAEPISLSKLKHSCDEDFLDQFSEYLFECCDSFNRLFHQKNVTLSELPTPIELNKFARLYSSGVLQNMVNFILSHQAAGPVLSDSYLSSDHRTGAFWRHETYRNKDRRPDCFSFQLRNHIDIMIRSKTPLSYSTLSSTNKRLNTRWVWEMKNQSLTTICGKQLQLFRERRTVEQYPGFVKQTIYPFNHTAFKVVSRSLTDRELQATAMMTGFGQTLATTQHKLPFLCRVDLLPQVDQSEAVNVVVTDGNRFCLAVYQCNTTNTCNTQTNAHFANGCAISEVSTITDESGLINRAFCRQLLGLLTAGGHRRQTRERAKSGRAKPERASRGLGRAKPERA